MGGELLENMSWQELLNEFAYREFSRPEEASRFRFV